MLMMPPISIQPCQAFQLSKAVRHRKFSVYVVRTWNGFNFKCEGCQLGCSMTSKVLSGRASRFRISSGVNFGTTTSRPSMNFTKASRKDCWPSGSVGGVSHVASMDEHQQCRKDIHNNRTDRPRMVGPAISCRPKLHHQHLPQ